MMESGKVDYWVTKVDIWALAEPPLGSANFRLEGSRSND
jgi:hypothetical protein